MTLKGIGLGVLVIIGCRIFAILLAASFGWDYVATCATLYAGAVGYLSCEVVKRGDR